MANEFTPVRLSDIEQFAPVTLKQIGITTNFENKQDQVRIAAAQKKQQLSPNSLPNSTEDYVALNPNATPEQIGAFEITKQQELLQNQLDVIQREKQLQSREIQDLPIAFAEGVVEVASVASGLLDLGIKGATAGNYNLDELLADTMGIDPNWSAKQQIQEDLRSMKSERSQSDQLEKQLKGEQFALERDHRIQMNMDEGMSEDQAAIVDFGAEMANTFVNIQEAGSAALVEDIVKNLPNLRGASKIAGLGKKAVEGALKKYATNTVTKQLGKGATAAAISEKVATVMKSANAQKLIGAGATAGATAAIAGMEGFSNAGEAKNFIQTMPQEVLAETEGYKAKAKENPDLTPAEIRTELANEVHDIALAEAGSAAIIPAAIMGTFLGKMATRVPGKASIKSTVTAGLEGGLREATEEFSQGTTGSISKTSAKDTVLQNRPITDLSVKDALDGAGREAAESAAAGFASGATFATVAEGVPAIKNTVVDTATAISDKRVTSKLQKELDATSPTRRAAEATRTYEKAYAAATTGEAKQALKDTFLRDTQPLVEAMATEVEPLQAQLETLTAERDAASAKMGTFDRSTKDGNTAFKEAKREFRAKQDQATNLSKKISFLEGIQSNTTFLRQGIERRAVFDATGFDIERNPEKVITSEKAPPEMRQQAINKILGMQKFGTHGTDRDPVADKQVLSDLLQSDDVKGNVELETRIKAKLDLVEYYEAIEADPTVGNIESVQTVTKAVLEGDTENKFFGIKQYEAGLNRTIAAKQEGETKKYLTGLVKFADRMQRKQQLVEQIAAIADKHKMNENGAYNDTAFFKEANTLVEEYKTQYPGKSAPSSAKFFVTVRDALAKEVPAISAVANKQFGTAVKIFPKMDITFNNNAPVRFADGAVATSPTQDTATVPSVAEQSSTGGQSAEEVIDDAPPVNSEETVAPDAPQNPQQRAAAIVTKSLETSPPKTKQDFDKKVEAFANSQKTWTAENKAAFKKMADALYAAKFPVAEEVTAPEQSAQVEATTPASEATAEAQQEEVATPEQSVENKTKEEKPKTFGQDTLRTLDQSLLEEIDFYTPIQKMMLTAEAKIQKLLKRLDWAVAKHFPSVKVNWEGDREDFNVPEARSKGFTQYSTPEIAKAMKAFEYLTAKPADRNSVRKLLGLKPSNKRRNGDKVTLLQAIAAKGGIDITSALWKSDFIEAKTGKLFQSGKDVFQNGQTYWPGHPVFRKGAGITHEDTLKEIFSEYFPEVQLAEEGVTTFDPREYLSDIIAEFGKHPLDQKYPIGSDYADLIAIYHEALEQDAVTENDSDEVREEKEERLRKIEEDLQNFGKVEKTDAERANDRLLRRSDLFTTTDAVFHKPLSTVATEMGYANEREMLNAIMDTLALKAKERKGILARNILISSDKERIHTLPAEYAYHYLQMFMEAPIVVKALESYGGEVTDARSMDKAAHRLAADIGKQVVAQKGQALNKWKGIVTWILGLMNKKEIKQVLTDSFLQNINLNKRFQYEDRNADLTTFGFASEENPEGLLHSLITQLKPKGLIGRTRDFSVLSIKTEDMSAKEKQFIGDVQSFVKDFKKTFKENIQPYVARNDKADSNVIRYQPLSLFTDKNGEFHDWVVELIALGVYNWYADSGKESLVNTKADINKFLGRDAKHPVTPAEYDAFIFTGTSQYQVAAQIGRYPLDAMGIKFDPDSTVYKYMNDVATNIGFAATAVMAMQEGVSIILPETESIKGVRANHKSNDDLAVPSAELQKIIDGVQSNQELFASLTQQEQVKLGRSKPVAPVTEIDNNGQETTPEAIAVINKLNSSPYYLRDALLTIADNVNQDQLMQVFGLDTRAETAIHVDNRTAVKSKNNQIKRHWGYIQTQRQMMENWKDKTNSPIYLAHFISTNGRYFIDSLLNPQGSKIIRHFLTKKENQSTIDLSDSTNDSLVLFKYAILEAFGAKINKITPDKVDEHFQQYLNKPEVVGAIAEINTAKTTPNTAIPNLVTLAGSTKENAWALSAVMALSEYADAITQGKQSFDTDFYIEFDGTTNGYFLAKFIMGLGGKAASAVLNGVQKFGVFHKNSPYSTVNEYKATTGNLDIYESVAEVFFQKLKAVMGDAYFPFESLMNPPGKSWLDTDNETGLGAGARNVFKTPITKFIYGAGFPGILREMQHDMLAHIRDKLEAAQGNDEALTAIKSDLRGFLIGLRRAFPTQINNPAIVAWANNFNKAPLETSLAELEEIIAPFFTVQSKVEQEGNPLNFGSVLKNAMIQFDPVINRNRELMIKGTSLIYTNYLGKVQEALGNAYIYDLTETELLTILDNFKSIAPIFRTFLTRNSKDILDDGYSLVSLDRRKPVMDEEGNSQKYDIIGNVTKGNTSVIHAQAGKTIPVFKRNADGSYTQRQQKEFSHTPSPLVLEQPSVKIVPGTTISTDAGAITPILAKYDVLGLHDAVAMGIAQAIEISDRINQEAFTAISEYSSLAAVAETFERIFTNDSMVPGNTKNAEKFRRELREAVEQYTSMRTAIIPEITSVGNYNPHLPEGTFKVTATDEVAQIAETEIKGTTLGSSQEGVDATAFINTPEQELNSANVLDIFDNLTTEGNVVESQPHSDYLRSLISEIYTKSMGTLQLAVATLGDLTKADIDLSNKRMRLQLASKATLNNMMMAGIRMSAQQAFTHELTHNHMAHAIDNNPDIAQQVRILFDKAAAEVTWEDFLTPGVTPTDVEIELAKNSWNYIFNNADTVKETSNYLYQVTTNERNPYLHEFSAFGLTNENLIRKLQSISLTRKELATGAIANPRKTIFTRLVELFNEALLRIKLMRQGQDINAPTNLHKELLRLAENVRDTNKKHTYKVVQKFKDANAYTASFTRAMFNKTQNNDSKTINAVIDGIDKVLLETNELEEFYRETMNEIMGSKPIHKFLENFARMNSKNLEQKPAHQKRHIAEVVESIFAAGVLTPVARTALHRVMLVADLSALVTPDGRTMDKHFTWDRIKKMLTTPKEVLNEIAAQEAALRKVTDDQTANFVEAQAQSLGAFLVTGMGTEVATYRTLPTEAAKPEIEAIWSKLVTLHALKYTDEASKTAMTNLMENSMAGIEATLRAYNLLRGFGKKHLPKQSRYLVKGELPQQLNHYKDMQMLNSNALDAAQMKTRRATLQKLGYVLISRQEVPLSGVSNTERTNTVELYGHPFNPKSTFDTGAIAYRNPFKRTLETIGTLHEKSEIKLQKSRGKQNDKPMYHTVVDSRQGESEQYLSYHPGEATLKTHLDKQENFSKTLGELGASMASERTTIVANQALSKKWAEEIQENREKTPSKYLLVPLDEKDVPPLYRKVRKEFLMLPAYLQKQFRDDGLVTDNNELIIHKDAIKLLFAKNRLNVTDLQRKDVDFDRDKAHEFLFKSLNNALYSLFHNKTGIYALKSAEEFVTLIKGTIVVKGMEVLMNNTVSNNILLLLLGVDGYDLIKWQYEGYKYAKEYQFLKKEVTQLELKMKIDPKEDTQANRVKASRLKDRIANNPTGRLFELGAFSAISEEIYTLDEESPFKGLVDSGIAKIAEHNPLSKRATTAFKTATIQQGTIGYRALMEMTQMSDFVARYVLWKQYTQNEGMSQEKAIEEVMDTFIVYDVVTNKWIQLANDLGLIMFTKFWLRTQRVIKKLAVDNPLYLALFLFGQYMMGDITDITDSFLFNAPGLNTPWELAGTIVTEQPIVKLLF